MKLRNEVWSTKVETLGENQGRTSKGGLRYEGKGLEKKGDQGLFACGIVNERSTLHN